MATATYSCDKADILTSQHRCRNTKTQTRTDIPLPGEPQLSSCLSILSHLCILSREGQTKTCHIHFNTSHHIACSDGIKQDNFLTASVTHVPIMLTKNTNCIVAYQLHLV